MTSETSAANAQAVPADEALLLRVTPDQVVFDKNQQRYRASGQVVDDEELSVYLSSLLRREGILFGHPDGWSVAALPAGAAYDQQQEIRPDPVFEDPPRPYDFAHALVVGKKSTKRRRRLAKATALTVHGDLSQCGYSGGDD